MYNTDLPTRAELPTSAQLIRSTVIAAVSAVVLLLTVVLPAEYAIDPTGIGRVLGLTEMGEIKARLAQEAAEDAAAKVPAPAAAAPAATVVPADAAPAAAPVSAPAGAAPAPPSSAAPAPVWRDERTFTLAPGQGTEIKLRMNQGERALYAWRVEGGVVNYDTHGDAQGRSISYVKGRGVAQDEGELVAAFSGQHGWFWRNRGAADVTVVLRTGGAYSRLERVK
jgi:hypothetical protein